MSAVTAELLATEGIMPQRVGEILWYLSVLQGVCVRAIFDYFFSPFPLQLQRAGVKYLVLHVNLGT